MSESIELSVSRFRADCVKTFEVEPSESTVEFLRRLFWMGVSNPQERLRVAS